MPKSSWTDRQRSVDHHHAPAQDKTTPGVIRSLLFDNRHEGPARSHPDSTWRGIRRREKALEKEAQQLLDLQASGLIAGSTGATTPADRDEYSDTGTSTPTGSTTAKLRMVNSLHIPTRSTPEGNVIPVRQPRPSQPRGLRSARTGLRRTMSALAQLKIEEGTHIEDALADRRKALSQLSQLGLRREGVSAELHTLEEDEEEPLGQELRDLGSRYESVTKEIRELEERLVGMRNQRRWIRGRIEDVRNRREAGLSGYRGALKDIDLEMTAIVTRPSVQPLDLEVTSLKARAEAPSTGGLEFMQMIPERRTAEMAKAWWESEVAILERQRFEVDADRRALEEGGAVWAEVTQLVSDYESRLRQLMKGEQTSVSVKGKEKSPSQEDLIRGQLSDMRKIMEDLEAHQHEAQEKGWNLLICAIGAELEAFTEAQEMLGALLTDDGEGQEEDFDQTSKAGAGGGGRGKNEEGSDNEVPADLLVSDTADDVISTEPPSALSPEAEPELKQAESENDVPPEFLAEHREKVD